MVKASVWYSSHDFAKSLFIDVQSKTQNSYFYRKCTQEKESGFYSICEGDFQEGDFLWFWFIPYLGWIKVWFLAKRFLISEQLQGTFASRTMQNKIRKVPVSRGIDGVVFILTFQADSLIWYVKRKWGPGGSVAMKSGLKQRIVTLPSEAQTGYETSPPFFSFYWSRDFFKTTLSKLPENL